MSLPITYHPDVPDEVGTAYRYYEARKVGLGDDFLSALEEVYAQLRAMPELYGTVWQTVRCAQLRRFPYAVYYQVDPDRVYVLAVSHNRRNPAGWQRRASSN